MTRRGLLQGAGGAIAAAAFRSRAAAADSVGPVMTRLILPVQLTA
jgi:hypothetical protein